MSAQHTPGPLKCGESLGGDGLQFTIESDWSTTKGEWNDRYVSFAGYFGSYGPHLFASAPELLEALESMVLLFEGTSGAGANYWEQYEEYNTARAAIAKAKGAA